MEVDINSNILVWAVERAGFNLDEIANKIPNFTSWLEGKKKPTFSQLEKFTQKVIRQINVESLGFFLQFKNNKVNFAATTSLFFSFIKSC